MAKYTPLHSVENEEFSPEKHNPFPQQSHNHLRYSTSQQQQEAYFQFQRRRRKQLFFFLLFFIVGISLWTTIPVYFFHSDTEDTSKTSHGIQKHIEDQDLIMAGRKHINAAYFVSWGIYAREHTVSKVDAEKISNLLYAFANLREDGEVFLGDPWADIEKHFDGDSWNDQGTNLYGNFKQLGLLKKRYRHLKVSLSIGGWTWSTNFAGVVANPDARKKFVATSMELLNDLGLDGLDIDWEYPKDSQEAKNFVTLLKELRHALDLYAESKNETNRYLLSAAVPCGEAKYKVMRLEEMNKYLDIFYLMAYDFEGAWSSRANHQSNLYNGEVSTDKAVRYYLKQGILSHKIILGIPMYGRAFKNTKGLGHSFNGVGEGTWEQGIHDYKRLPRPGAVEYFDEKAIASYSYDPDARELITYDTPQVVQYKCRYIYEKELGGSMFWELSGDYATDHERSLLAAAYRGLGGAGVLENSDNHMSYPNSKYENVKNQYN
ncbi:hypothetical protein G9A89_022193 [Geosiphon pyriformis]|nr:hypothetical protein G9A89_022193 [Geosiphon pyriformis]